MADIMCTSRTQATHRHSQRSWHVDYKQLPFKRPTDLSRNTSIRLPTSSLQRLSATRRLLRRSAKTATEWTTATARETLTATAVKAGQTVSRLAQLSLRTSTSHTPLTALHPSWDPSWDCQSSNFLALRPQPRRPDQSCRPPRQVGAMIIAGYFPKTLGTSRTRSAVVDMVNSTSKECYNLNQAVIGGWAGEGQTERQGQTER